MKTNENLEKTTPNSSADKPDIFDRLMHLPVLNILEPFYKKNKSVLLYLFFGGIAFVMYFALYALFEKIGLHEIVSTILCNIICITFQFFTNRTYCFESHVETFKEFMVQLGEFFTGRAGTFAADLLITYIFITCLNCNEIIVKIVDQILIIVSNYLISKFWVFKEKNKTEEE